MRTLCIAKLCSVLLFFPSLVIAQNSHRDWWNKPFLEHKIDFKKGPSPLLVHALEGRKPGEALDLGMGEGRNAIFLAQQGWRVTGVDYSDVAVNLARARAAKLGLSLQTVVKDLDAYDFGRERWDLIVLFYMHAWFHTSPTDPPLRVLRALRPGGLLVMEGYAGGKDEFQTNELPRLFDKLRIIYYQDVTDEAEWDPGRRSRIVRFIGEKTS